MIITLECIKSSTFKKKYLAVSFYNNGPLSLLLSRYKLTFYEENEEIPFHSQYVSYDLLDPHQSHREILIVLPESFEGKTIILKYSKENTMPGRCSTNTSSVIKADKKDHFQLLCLERSPYHTIYTKVDEVEL